MDVTPLILRANIIYCLKGSYDKSQSYIGKTKRHLVVRVQGHLSGQSGKSSVHEHITSCKDCHSCSIRNIHTLAHANTDFEAKIKERLYVYKNIHQN